jgi:hypothetical protein
MTRLLAIGAAALVVMGTGLGVLQAPAPAQTTAAAAVVIKLGARAHLSADGKTAKVKVTITCKNATPAPISATVSQNRGSVTAQGSGKSGTSYRCNGRSQHGIVPVKADPGQHFHTGGAFATADVTVSGVSDHDERNIQLT